MADKEQSSFEQNNCLPLNKKFSLRLRCYIKVLLIVAILQGLPLAKASESSTSDNPQNHLKSFIDNHLRQHGLEALENQKTIITRKANEAEFYLFNSVEYVQICFSQKDSNYSLLPHLLRFRSYHPVHGSSSKGVRCYQIFNKLQLLQKQYSSEPNFPEGKKLNKQHEYLRNQYELAEWIHNFGKSVNSVLTQIANQRKLLLNGLQVFALHFYRSDDSISLINAWITKGIRSQYKIVKKLDGRGLHRKVTYKIQLNNRLTNDINAEQCEVRIIQTLSHKIYIDVDEVKSQGIKINLEEGHHGDGVSFINIEKPAYESRQYQYELSTSWGAWRNTKVDQFQIQLPVHFRYPTPFKIDQEKFFQYVEEELYPTTLARVACNFTGELQFYHLQEDYLTGKGSALVPVGDNLMKSVVNVVTLGSQVICAIILVKQLRK